MKLRGIELNDFQAILKDFKKAQFLKDCLSKITTYRDKICISKIRNVFLFEIYMYDVKTDEKNNNKKTKTKQKQTKKNA